MCIRDRCEGDKLHAQEILDRIDIATVDSFQGRDKEIIFYCFVRSSPQHGIGFESEVRRLNVTMTRAKRLLVMVGDSETLTQTRAKKPPFQGSRYPREYFSALLDYCLSLIHICIPASGPKAGQRSGAPSAPAHRRVSNLCGSGLGEGGHHPQHRPPPAELQENNGYGHPIKGF